ncbi:MAG: hypothetical protein KJ847_04670 [Firmicutes bacterium]|nr:hypothetical protein [Bacillota bacterium]
MRVDRLVNAEKQFLSMYPEGFRSELMEEMRKKHNFDKIVDFCHASFSKENLKNKKMSIENISRFVSKSSMVSVFEKMRFRDFIKEMDDVTQFEIVDAVRELIHTNEESGFNKLVNILGTYNLAKWPLITVYLAYYNPTKDVFVKPNTVKMILRVLEINEVKYHSKPTYDFYVKYRKIINEMKVLVYPSLSPSNAAFSGFLMMTLQ